MDKNPYNICTLDSNSNCKECKNQGLLDCKLDKNLQNISVKTVLSYIIISLFGVSATAIIISNWWIVILYILFLFLFFFIFEVRLTCSHCPYYAEKTNRLNCPGNNISIKIWKFHPEPMNRFEKIGSISGFIFMGGFPITIQLYGLWYFITQDSNINLITIIAIVGILIATITTLLIFALIFFNLFCKRCVNFSCPFNKVPKQIRNEYIKRNLTLKYAWEKNGYKF